MMEIDQVKPVETPDEMRAELFRLSCVDPLAYSVFESANLRGLSAEDRYTLLAYMALKSLNELRQRQIDYMRAQPSPPIFLDAEKY